MTRTLNATTTTYFYDGHNIVQELSGATPVANLLSDGIDEVFSRSESTGTLGPLVDGLGSTIGLSNSSGAVPTQYTYDPFGRTTVSGGASGSAYQYTGRENDSTGLYFYRARYYSPTLHRFISIDPIGFSGGDANLYAYVANSPVNKVDPFGLWPMGPVRFPPINLYYIPPVTINFTPPITPGVGVGVVISRTGIYPQIVLLNSPGISAMIPLFPFSEEPNPGWSSGFSACYGGCASSTGDNGGGLNSQVGLGTPGGGAPLIYTFPPWKWPDTFGRKN